MKKGSIWNSSLGFRWFIVQWLKLGCNFRISYTLNETNIYNFQISQGHLHLELTITSTITGGQITVITNNHPCINKTLSANFDFQPVNIEQTILNDNQITVNDTGEIHIQ